jgi:hypothetical protein
MNALTYHAKSPLRPPDWRNLQARYYAERGRPAPRGADSTVRRNTRLLRAAARGPERHARVAMHPEYRAVAEARDLAQPGFGDLVRAYVLAGTPAADIAAKFGVDPTLITEFERCFFDVRDRLPHAGVVLQVLGRPDPQNPRPWLMGWLAASWGRDALEQFVTDHVSPALQRKMEEAARSRLVTNAYQAALIRPINGKTASTVLREYLKLKQVMQATEREEFRRECGRQTHDLKRLKAQLEHREEELRKTAEDLQRQKKNLEETSKKILEDYRRFRRDNPPVEVHTPVLATLRPRRRQAVATPAA